MRSVSAILSRWPARISTVALTHLVLTLLDWPFDNILYPTVLLWQGPYIGAAIMMALALIVNLALLLIYVRIGEDWLGVNGVEYLKERGHVWVDRLYARPRSVVGFVVKGLAYVPSRVYLIALWALRKNDGTAFVALSIFEDAFRTTAFLRHGRTDPMSKGDWRIFWGSVVVSNLYWSFRWSVIIGLAKIWLPSLFT